MFFLFQTVRHGFPYQPTCLAFDPVQKILAIGSRTGGIRMYPFLSLHPSLPPPDLSFCVAMLSWLSFHRVKPVRSPAPRRHLGRGGCGGRGRVAPQVGDYTLIHPASFCSYPSATGDQHGARWMVLTIASAIDTSKSD